MRQATIGLAAALLCSTALAAAALADVTVVGDFVKTKTVNVNQNVIIDPGFTLKITKDIFIVAGIDELDLNNGAEALTIVNQRNENNTFTSPSSGDDIRTASLTGGSVSLNIGVIFGVNQDAGNFVKQANAVSFGFTDDDEAFVNAEASAEQINSGNSDIATGGLLNRDLDAQIWDSINFNVGIGGVNQNAGNSNDQLNAVAVAVGLDGNPAEEGDGAVVLAEADLGQTTTGHTVFEVGIDLANPATRDALIGGNNGSINGNLGIFGVNQAVGDNTNQANIVSFAAIIN